MLFGNSTKTSIELLHGDIRQAAEPFAVIGRDPVLKAHFECKVGKEFQRENSSRGGNHVELLRAADRSLSVLRVTYRPRNQPREFERQVDRLRSEVEGALANTLGLCGATCIAMSPLSCRQPEVVATAMVRMIWSMSVAAFLDVDGPFQSTKPQRFRIYSIDGIEPFVAALASADNYHIDHGWLFSTALICHRAKRQRFINRNGFRYQPAKGFPPESTSV